VTNPYFFAHFICIICSFYANVSVAAQNTLALFSELISQIILCAINNTGQRKNTFCIKREYDIIFLANFWVLIPDLALIFLWHIKFWNYSERLFWVYKQLYANILLTFFFLSEK